MFLPNLWLLVLASVARGLSADWRHLHQILALFSFFYLTFILPGKYHWDWNSFFKGALAKKAATRVTRLFYNVKYCMRATKHRYINTVHNNSIKIATVLLCTTYYKHLKSLKETKFQGFRLYPLEERSIWSCWGCSRDVVIVTRWLWQVKTLPVSKIKSCFFWQVCP